MNIRSGWPLLLQRANRARYARFQQRADWKGCPGTNLAAFPFCRLFRSQQNGRAVFRYTASGVQMTDVDAAPVGFDNHPEQRASHQGLSPELAFASKLTV